MISIATRSRWLPKKVFARRCFEQSFGASTAVRHKGHAVADPAIHWATTRIMQKIPSPDPTIVIGWL